MGKTVALDPRFLHWAREQFAAYYRAAHVEPPPRLARREFAAFPFGAESSMRRHLAIPTPEGFEEMLRREVPRHVYYSSAYYRVPDHPKMDGKEWLGADVIFDLDADHLRGADRLPYSGQLDLVKERVRSLYDEFLVGDFGIDPRDLTLVFSGGRGYHVHVRDTAYLTLTSPERRELVDYVQATGFDPTRAIRETREDAESAESRDLDSGGRRPAVRPFKRLASPETGGWKGRTTRAVLATLARWEAQGEEATRAELQRRGVSKSRAASFAKLLLEEGRARQIRESLSLEVFPKGLPPEFAQTVLHPSALEVQGETDAPVTTDINRLIRLPGSLHGGTGFRVTALTRAELDPFDPFAPVGPSTPESGRTRVVLSQDVEYPFPEPVRGDAGESVELATPSALFLVLRGEAALPP